MYKAVFTVVAPHAKTVTYRFPELPEDREIWAMCDRLGTVASIAVYPPTPTTIQQETTS